MHTEQVVDGLSLKIQGTHNTNSIAFIDFTIKRKEEAVGEEIGKERVEVYRAGLRDFWQLEATLTTVLKISRGPGEKEN